MDAITISAGVVFIAEFGDKSQLLALTMAARHRLGSVVLAVVVTAVVATSLSAFAGGLVRTLLPPTAAAIAAGALFVAFGVAALRERDGDVGGDDATWAGEGSVVASRAARRSALALTAALLVAELGDKTMFATAGLAAELGVVVSWAGAALGMALAGLVGVFVGARLARWVPPHVVRIASGVVFVVVGASFLWSAFAWAAP